MGRAPNRRGNHRYVARQNPPFGLVATPDTAVDTQSWPQNVLFQPLLIKDMCLVGKQGSFQVALWQPQKKVLIAFNAPTPVGNILFLR
jgi:hypothetical protein